MTYLLVCCLFRVLAAVAMSRTAKWEDAKLEEASCSSPGNRPASAVVGRSVSFVHQNQCHVLDDPRSCGRASTHIVVAALAAPTHAKYIYSVRPYNRRCRRSGRAAKIATKLFLVAVNIISLAAYV